MVSGLSVGLFKDENGSLNIVSRAGGCPRTRSSLASCIVIHSNRSIAHHIYERTMACSLRHYLLAPPLRRYLLLFVR